MPLLRTPVTPALQLRTAVYSGAILRLRITARGCAWEKRGMGRQEVQVGLPSGANRSAEKGWPDGGRVGACTCYARLPEERYIRTLVLREHKNIRWCPGSFGVLMIQTCVYPASGERIWERGRAGWRSCCTTENCTHFERKGGSLGRQERRRGVMCKKRQQARERAGREQRRRKLKPNAALCTAHGGSASKSRCSGRAAA